MYRASESVPDFTFPPVMRFYNFPTNQPIKTALLVHNKFHHCFDKSYGFYKETKMVARDDNKTCRADRSDHDRTQKSVRASHGD